MRVIYGLCILNYYFIGSIYYLHFVCSQVVYFLFFMQYFLLYMRFVYFIYFFYAKYCFNFRGGSRIATTTKMERFVIIVNGFQPLKERLLDFKCFPLLLNSKNLIKWKMKIELHWNNQMKIIMSLQSFCLGRGIFGMWDVGCVGCWVCGILGMWDVGDVGCLGCGMFRVWDMGCSLGCGMLI